MEIDVEVSSAEECVREVTSLCLTAAIAKYDPDRSRCWCQFADEPDMTEDIYSQYESCFLRPRKCVYHSQKSVKD